MAPKQLSPICLNNKGVFLLELGRYGCAARCFAKAFNATICDITTRQRAKLNVVPTAIVCCRRKNGFSQPANACEVLSGSVQDTVQPVEDEAALQAGPPASESYRKCEGGSTEVTSCSRDNSLRNLGRPLRIKAKHRRTVLDNSYLSATLLYNLGLSFNMMENQDLHVCRKALVVYQMAAEIVLRLPLSTSLESPLILVILHNLSNVHDALGEHGEASKCQGKLARVLQLMRASRGLREMRYETFYINLISLYKTGTKAAAA